MSTLIKRLQKRYVVEGDELARDAIACIRELEATLNELVGKVDPSERKHRTAIRNARALLAKLKNGESQ